MKPYSEEIEEMMKDFYHHLSEKDRRLYAAIEAKKLPHGGKVYISSLFECSRVTLDQGIHDLSHFNSLPQEQVRREGGGIKRKIDSIPHLEEHFLTLIKDYTAGDPQKGKLWTNLSQDEISSRLKEANFDVGRRVVKQLLKKHGFGRKKAVKIKRGGDFEMRNEQFEKIAQLRSRYEKSENAILSIDGKKKRK